MNYKVPQGTVAAAQSLLAAGVGANFALLTQRAAEAEEAWRVRVRAETVWEQARANLRAAYERVRPVVDPEDASVSREVGG